MKNYVTLNILAFYVFRFTAYCIYIIFLIKNEKKEKKKKNNTELKITF